MTEANPKRSNLSWNAALVLKALVEGRQYGFDIMSVTSLASGSVYPLLRRLEGSGLVQSRWEDETVAHNEGRPARRYYEATDAGRVSLAAAMLRIAVQQRVFGIASGEEGGA